VHRQHHTVSVYEVCIEMHVPNGKLVFSDEPRPLTQAEPAHVAAAKIRSYVHAAEATPGQFHGQVSGLHPDTYFGFVPEERRHAALFHRDSVTNGELRP
jgi:hypothetical protein